MSEDVQGMLYCSDDQDNEDSAPRDTVSGNCSEIQIIESLTRYHRRPIFAKEALYALFTHTQHAPQYNKHQLELVLRCMTYHQNSSAEAYAVQLAGSACVYNLTNRESGSQIPVPVLSQVVTATLVTMNLFSHKRQLQKNCLMILCNERILKNVIHYGNPCVQTRILGLLNNLAEVAELRPYLLLLHNKTSLIQNVRTLLASEHIEVCYFAAGVISHLAMLDDAEWDSRLNCSGMRKACLEDVFSCVLSWKPPDGEMVAYRTLKPFFPLLRRHDIPAVQLWAAWAMRHVCLKNGEKYREMLLREKGVECLQEIYREPMLDENVAKLVRLTLDLIND